MKLALSREKPKSVFNPAQQNLSLSYKWSVSKCPLSYNSAIAGADVGGSEISEDQPLMMLH
jgi:hypothetical protein